MWNEEDIIDEVELQDLCIECKCCRTHCGCDPIDDEAEFEPSDEYECFSCQYADSDTVPE